jgi:hypothetical protein
MYKTHQVSAATCIERFSFGEMLGVLSDKTVLTPFMSPVLLFLSALQSLFLYRSVHCGLSLEGRAKKDGMMRFL